MKKTDVIYSKPVAQKIIDINKKENPRWLSLYNTTQGDGFLIACGAKTVNSVNTVPYTELWRKLDKQKKYDYVYNRFCHVVIELTEKPTSFELLFMDSMVVHLNYRDLKTLDVQYLYSSYELKSGKGASLKKVYDHNGSYIYKVLND